MIQILGKYTFQEHINTLIVDVDTTKVIYSVR